MTSRPDVVRATAAARTMRPAVDAGPSSRQFVQFHADSFVVDVLLYVSYALSLKPLLDNEESWEFGTAQ